MRLAYIKNKCSRLVRNHYKLREHDLRAKVLHWKLRKVVATKKQAVVCVQTEENGGVVDLQSSFWDFPTQTDSGVRA